MALVIAVLWLLCAASAPAQVSREYQIKAAVLFQFIQFTDWPTNAFATNDSPIVIGVLGADPFGPALDEVVRDEVVRGRKLQVERYRSLGEVGACHVLFIAQSEARQLNEIVAQMKGRPVLTVSDIEAAAVRGVMMRLYTEANRIRFRVNLQAITEANLTVSSKLLRTAEIVTPPSSQR